MVKTKLSNQSVKFWKSLYDFKAFTKKLNHLDLLLYSGILVTVIALVSVGRNLTTGFQTFNAVESFFYTFFGLPILAVIVYALFYLFLNAFESKRKGFFESYLVFLSITLPFLLIVHLLNWLKLILSGTSVLLMNLLIAIIAIYYIVNVILNFKNYYQTSAFRVLASFILVDVMFMFLGMLQYMSYLMLNIR